MTCFFGMYPHSQTFAQQADSVCGIALENAASERQFILDCVWWLDAQFQEGVPAVKDLIGRAQRSGHNEEADIFIRHLKQSEYMWKTTRVALLLAARGVQHPGVGFDFRMS